MTYARNQIHVLRDCEDASSAECTQLSELLDQVENDRLHAEAKRLRDLATGYKPGPRHKTVQRVAEHLDPYEWVDGQLVRKLDGKPVSL